MKLLKHQRPNIDKIYFFLKDPFESKYQLFINGWEKIGIKNVKDPNAFIDYSQAIHNVYGYLEDCNPRRKRRVLIVFDDIVSDMESNKKLSSTNSFKSFLWHWFYRFHETLQRMY